MVTEYRHRLRRSVKSVNNARTCIFFVLFCVCIISLSVSLLDISRTLIINYRWPAAIGLVPLWQPLPNMFNTIVSFACICYVSVCIWRIKYYYYWIDTAVYKHKQNFGDGPFI